MPSSHWSQISEIIDAVLKLKPSSILDVGIGMGKYGLLCREYLEVWEGRLKKEEWTVRIDGIDIFHALINQLHHFVYDRVFIGDALEIVDKMGRGEYDLVLMIDLIEHLPPERGEKLLSRCKEVGKRIIVSTPKIYHQPLYDFGESEHRHHSHWTRQMLIDRGANFFLKNPHSNIALLAPRDDSSLYFLRKSYIFKRKVIAALTLMRLIKPFHWAWTAYKKLIKREPV